MHACTLCPINNVHTSAVAQDTWTTNTLEHYGIFGRGLNVDLRYDTFQTSIFSVRQRSRFSGQPCLRKCVIENIKQHCKLHNLVLVRTLPAQPQYPHEELYNRLENVYVQSAQTCFFQLLAPAVYSRAEALSMQTQGGYTELNELAAAIVVCKDHWVLQHSTKYTATAWVVGPQHSKILRLVKPGYAKLVLFSFIHVGCNSPHCAAILLWVGTFRSL